MKISGVDETPQKPGPLLNISEIYQCRNCSIEVVFVILIRDRIEGVTDQRGGGDQKSHSGPFSAPKAPKISLCGPFLGPKMGIFDILRRRRRRKKIFEF